MTVSASAVLKASPRHHHDWNIASWYNEQSRPGQSAMCLVAVATAEDIVARYLSSSGRSSSAVEFIQRIRQIILVSDPVVDSFLLRNPYLQEPILDVRNRLLDYLPGSSLSLELFVDPEEDDQFLVLYVRTCYPADVAAEKLNSFFVDWWCGRMNAVRGKLAINLKFSDDV